MRQGNVDGTVHPNRTGYRAMSELLRPAVVVGRPAFPYWRATVTIDQVRVAGPQERPGRGNGRHARRTTGACGPRPAGLTGAVRPTAGAKWPGRRAIGSARARAAARLHARRVAGARAARGRADPAGAARRRAPRRRAVRRRARPGRRSAPVGLPALRPVRRRGGVRGLARAAWRPRATPLFYALVGPRRRAAARDGVVPAHRAGARQHRDRPHLVRRRAAAHAGGDRGDLPARRATPSTASATGAWSGSATPPTRARAGPRSASASPSRACSASTWWSRGATATRPGTPSSTASGPPSARRSSAGWTRRTSTRPACSGRRWTRAGT